MTSLALSVINPDTMANCMLSVFMLVQSQEGAALVEVQTSALFGDLKVLQKQMQEAVGQDATSIEELMQRVQVRCCTYCVQLCEISNTCLSTAL